MPISNLQLALIVAGVLLVLGVLIYNAWLERRVRRRIESAFRPSESPQPSRVEPTLKSLEEGDRNVSSHASRPTPAHSVAAPRSVEPAEFSFVPPMDVIE